MNMKDKLKEVFSQIQAEEELKNRTEVFLAKKTQGYTRVKTQKRMYYVCAAACVCLLLMLLGGCWMYFTPIAQISIDINPSIELSINRFDQVISVNGFNEDGRELSNALDVKFKNYTDAIEQILNDDIIAALLSNNEVMTIMVTGSDGIQSSRILSKVESCTAGQRNTYCYFAPSEDVTAAHEMGLSYGKYRAFLEVQLLDPDITPETVQGMTMREIRELIDSLSTDGENQGFSCNKWGNGRHGYGNVHRGGGEGKREKQSTSA